MTQRHPQNELVEDDPLVRLARRPTAMRALVALTNARGEPLTAATIARMGNFSRRAWYDGVADLLFELGLIERAGDDADAQRYRARFDTASLDAFKQFRAALGRAAEERDPAA